MSTFASHRRLPNADLSLPAFGLGCAPLGGLHKPMPAGDAKDLIEAAFEAGVTFFDTAPYYGYTTSERRLGAALAEHDRESFVLSTKVGRRLVPTAGVSRVAGGWHEAGPFRPVFDYTYDGVMRSFEDSLQRLGLERVDILLVHDIGRLTHGDDNAIYWNQLTEGGGWRALASLKSQGLARAIGIGVNECEVVHDCLDATQPDCVMLAGRYTLLDHAGAIPLMDRCAQRGVAVLAAGPFNSGVLAGGATFDYRPTPQHVLARVDALRKACEQADVPLRAAALQFPLAHPATFCCVAGAHSRAELAGNASDLQARIPDSFWQALRAQGLVDERAPLPRSGVGRMS
jgi:D-threo-aldose 1-dehydrogenase